ncbi:hypothetical protein BASA81_001335 [Batrachochytrium salamandrivorans]|nr:hypothetical protein BASA81_001335 [Batrachochytrium salamandrivorans]
MTLARDAQVGFLVGSFDVALLWPFVREAGSPSLKHSLKQGKLWSGGSGAVMMLVPYSIVVESLNNAMSHPGSQEQQTLSSKLSMAPLTSFIIAAGLQPIEKKLVMDSLLQTERSGKGPVVDLVRYAQKHGMRRLYGGFLPLWARETIYVSATMVLNPWWTTTGMGEGAAGVNCLKAFALGFSAGMISAPCQTLSVMAKDEVPHREKLTLNRLFYGSMTRSIRTGAAGVLWFLARRVSDNE